MTTFDWNNGANHIAVNPAQPEAADGLEEFLTSQAFKGLCLFQTSGSEGTPKWVGLTKNAFMISAEAVNAHFEVTAEDHWLIALPLHHVGGFSILARAHLSHSRVTHSTAKWHPQDFTRLIETERITLVSLVPAQVHDLVQARLTAPDTLRAAIIGGGGMSQSLADSALELGWRVFQTYGMTEAASQIATQPYNPFGPVFDVKSLEVLPHWQVRTSDAHLDPSLDQPLDALDPLLDPKPSPLVLSGPALSPGYARRTAAGTWHWDPIPPTGLITRDLVRLWQHGTRQYLQFIGRDSGYVKILGELLHLAPLQEQIETLARQHGWPTPPVLLPIPDPRAETQLLLITEPGSPDPDPLLTAFHAASPPWLKITRTSQVESIPRTALGKVRQDELRQQVVQLGPNGGSPHPNA